MPRDGVVLGDSWHAIVVVVIRVDHARAVAVLDLDLEAVALVPGVEIVDGAVSDAGLRTVTTKSEKENGEERSESDGFYGETWLFSNHGLSGRNGE